MVTARGSCQAARDFRQIHEPFSVNWLAGNILKRTYVMCQLTALVHCRRLICWRWTLLEAVPDMLQRCSPSTTVPFMSRQDDALKYYSKYMHNCFPHA
jgi:hypothetical protein